MVAGCQLVFPANEPVCFASSNVGNTFSPTAGSLTVGDTAARHWVFDTETGEITAYEQQDRSFDAVQIRPAGSGSQAGVGFAILAVTGSPSGVGVFTVGQLDVLDTGTILGVGPRPLVILAATTIEISGVVTVGSGVLANERHVGPGGSLGGAPANPAPGLGGGGAAAPNGGGGGGSFGGSGGTGGSGGGGGAVFGTASLEPVFGGGGGGGGRSFVPGAIGGDGGGAVQLSACGSIRIQPNGIVDAGGSGGGATSENGGGGGAGGAILLEARVIEIAGFIGANGGGGGGGGESGRRGDPLEVPALGGASMSIAHGGNGNDRVGIAGDGGAMTGCCSGGGGGGGGGRVRINTTTGTESFAAGISPSIESGLTTVGTIAR